MTMGDWNAELHFGHGKKPGKALLEKFLRILEKQGNKIESYSFSSGLLAAEPTNEQLSRIIKIPDGYLIKSHHPSTDDPPNFMRLPSAGPTNEQLSKLIKMIMKRKISNIDFTFLVNLGNGFWGRELSMSLYNGVPQSSQSGLYYLSLSLCKGFKLANEKEKEVGCAALLRLFFTIVKETSPFYAYLDDRDGFIGYSEVLVKENGDFRLEKNKVRTLDEIYYNSINFLSAELVKQIGKQKIIVPNTVEAFETSKQGIVIFDKKTIENYNLKGVIEKQQF